MSESPIRKDGRANDEIRPLKITRNYLKWPEGSVLVEVGETKVIITASVEESVPRFLRDSGKGWITAEYDMLPRATDRRRNRDRNRKIPGRSMEIQRLIGRSIRAAFDIDNIGEISIKIDADVIQADGGTRCASIVGSFVATYDAIQKAVENRIIVKMPSFSVISAISVGIIKGIPMLDLPYVEDSQAEVDMNIISSEDGKFIEIQGTAEGKNFSRDELNQLLDLAVKGNSEIIIYIKKLLNL
ncbi:ribonuclease PH [Promethearchaeum syntrophicum]|uniref:Ribonuclease PH n=1 Tax=Promethearchaeum syntrophicum TaxID=2594042 RepID=A0A5B9DEZ5_9ARCH